MSKILLDTNILIYSIDEDSKYFQSAQNLILNNTSDELYTTSKNISEFLAVVTRMSQNSLNIEDALQITEDFSNLLTILYPSPLSFSKFQYLLIKYKPRGIKIHDFEIVSIALAHQIDFIATLNEKDFEFIKEIKLYSL